MPGGVAGERPVKAVPYADACDFVNRSYRVSCVGRLYLMGWSMQQRPGKLGPTSLMECTGGSDGTAVFYRASGR